MLPREFFRIAPSHYHVGHVVPAMVAKEISFFEEEGLDEYEVVLGGQLPAIAERAALGRAVKEKSIDVVPDAKPSSIFAHRDRGEELFIVGCWRNRMETLFIGAKGLKSLRDLKGKRIGVRDPGDIGYTMLSPQLRKVGLDPEKDIVWVSGSRFHGQAKPEDLLRSGEVDCIYIGAESDRGLVAEGYSLLLDSRTLFGGARPSRIIAATRKTIEERTSELESYLRATIRAYWFLVDQERNGPYHRALVRRLRRGCMDEEESQRESLEAGGASVVPFDGAPSIEGLRAILTEMQEAQEVRRSVTLQDCVRLAPVENAFRALTDRPGLRDEMERARELYAKRDAEAPSV